MATLTSGDLTQSIDQTGKKGKALGPKKVAGVQPKKRPKGKR